MGRKFRDVSEEMKIVPYKVVEGPNSDVRVDIKDEQFCPPEISAMILQKLKRDAEAFLGTEVTEAVITVPAYFDDAQRQATKDAGLIAGLEVSRIINEPTAASLAYGLDKETEQTILVFDLGGGTFDVSVLELGEGVFEVKSTNGDTHLGGDNWDKAIVDWIVAEFLREKAVDLSKDRSALQRLYEAAEKAKVELSSVIETTINQPFITMDSSGPLHLEMALTRAKLEELTRDLLERVVAPTRQAMKDANLNMDDIQPGGDGGRHDPHAGRDGEGARARGQGTPQGHEPGRSGGARRGHPGRRAGGRRQGRAAARRDPALAGHRDQGWRVHQADRTEHHHPHAQE